MVEYGHFQTWNLFPLAQIGTPCAPREVFWWESLLLQVSEYIEYKKFEEIEKK